MASPLDVLREARAWLPGAYLSDVDAALTRVEALVEAAKGVTFAIWTSEPDEVRAHEAFIAALAPFVGSEDQ